MVDRTRNSEYFLKRKRLLFSLAFVNIDKDNILHADFQSRQKFLENVAIQSSIFFVDLSATVKLNKTCIIFKSPEY